jgi:hypothetical protein
MSTQGPFDSGQGFTVFRDEPKTNGTGSGRQDNETTDLPSPNWLRHQLSHSRYKSTSRITVPDGHALTRLVRLIAGAREGERNNFTYWAACRAGEMVASGLLDPDAAAAVIAEAATRAGLPRGEAERVAWNGIKTTGGVTHA